MTFELSAKKLQFKSPSFPFMGHKLTDNGVEPDPAKVAAITGMPQQLTKQECSVFSVCPHI